MASFYSFPSSSSSGRGNYDVFLSFRGEDTRNNFVDQLYVALNQKGIYTFKDDHMLLRGELISQELLKAIEESKSVIVVLSENYANSSWCLDELVKIMECRNLIGQRVLPVFYHVDPSDVRGLKRNFATAFQQHEVKFRGEQWKLNKWREALVTASNLSGFHFSNSVGGVSEFINKIVQDIIHHIKPYDLENNLIGIESRMDALKSLLDKKATKEVCVVGICGMAGIGKTTIAQAIFRRIAYKFEGSSFVNDVRENSSNKKALCALQEKILKDILKIDHFMIQDLDRGAEMIQRVFSNKKVLLVLDDVDNVKQKEFLAATKKWFGPGSRIIITTRDEHLLADSHFKYKPNCLLMDQAIELFSRYAFQKNSPPEGYTELSFRAVRYTGYLPLALKVLGSFFRGRQANVWESALNRLAKTPNFEIFETLKLSFDGLDVSEKNIFLDIACFFKGKDKEHVTRILDSFGFDPVIGIRVLIEKSLITVLNEKLGMHDLIQEMGWKIARDSFRKSRIWERQDIHDVINTNRKLKAIEGIVLTDREYHDVKQGVCAKFFRRVKNLRLLDVDSKFTSCQPTFLPDKLRWLCWRRYPYSFLPVEHMFNLVGLEIFSGNMIFLWEQRQNLPNLKFVNLTGSLNLTKLPDISGAPNIERLIISNCKMLVKVHQSLGFHKKLVYSDMSGCKWLKCLPFRIDMESLETLILSSCRRLKTFPKVSPSMVKLSKLCLDHCVRLEELPSSIRYLCGLSFLNLRWCKNLKNIPDSICQLKHLKSLHLDNCMNLQKLPVELGNMINLKELLLGLPEKKHYERLPESISFHTFTSLCSLRKLDLSWRQIEEKDFPQNFMHFPPWKNYI